jgi:hypothetical protein
MVRSAGFEPATSGISSQPLFHIGVRAHGASGRSRTACLFLTKEALCRVSYRGVAGDPGFEPRPAGSEPAVLPDYTSLHWYGRRDSNAHWTGFEPAVCCHWTTPACAARGSNPVLWIKSPVHHPSCLRRSERIAGIEPAFSVWRTAALPLSYIRVVPAGTEPASAGFQPAANPSQLENHGREAGTRTPSAWSQTRRADPYATSREWRCPESNRVGNACRARPLTSATHPQVPGGWRLPAMLTLWSCQLTCTFAPQGGAPHGRKDSNPDQAGWSRLCLPLHHAHMCSVMQTARQGDFPAGGFLVSASASTREPPRWYRASRTAGWRRANPDSASLRTCVP